MNRDRFRYILRIIMGIAVILLGITEDLLWFKILGIVVGVVVITIGIIGLLKPAQDLNEKGADHDEE